MKKMKHAYRSLVIKLLGLFGAVALVQCSQSDYGCPSASFTLKGTVMEEGTNMPLDSIQVHPFYDGNEHFAPGGIDEYYTIVTDNNGRFELNLYGDYWDYCGGEDDDRQLLSDLYHVYFYDPDSTYQLTDTVLGIVAKGGHGERDIVIYMKKNKQ